MATASVTYVSGLSGTKPSVGYRVTGGSESDRLTIQDIVDATPSLEYDPRTGLVTQTWVDANFALSFESGSTYLIVKADALTTLHTTSTLALRVGDMIRVNGYERVVTGWDVSPISVNLSTINKITLDDAIPGVTATNFPSGELQSVAQTILLGGARPAYELASGSTTTVLQFASGTDLSEYAANNKIIVGDVEATISSIDSSADTITLTSALSEAPASGVIARPGYNCYVHLENCTIQLRSRFGSDSDSNDLGNRTSKLLCTHQCDIEIGNDLTGDPVQNPGILIRATNYSQDFYQYIPFFTPYTKVVCHGLVRFALDGNSRVSLVNRLADNVIRVGMIGFGADPYVEDGTGATPGINVDLNTSVGEIYFYAQTISARRNLVPGNELTAPGISVPTWVSHPDNLPRVYFNTLVDLNRVYVLADVEPREYGSEDAPRFGIQYADSTWEVQVILRRWKGGRTADAFRVSNNDGNLQVSIESDVTFSLITPAGASVTGTLKVEGSSFTRNFPSTNGATPTLTETQYGDVQDFTSVSEQLVRLVSHEIAATKNGNQNFRNLPHSSAAFGGGSAARYSAWAFGKQIVYRTALTVSSGEQAVSVQMVPDNYVTSASAADVPSAADTLDDVYDILYGDAITNTAALPGSMDSTGTLDVGARNVTLALGGSLSVSSTALTIPCGATLAIGSTIRGLKTTGTVTIGTGVTVTAPYEDSAGVRVLFANLPANHEGVVACWPKSQGEDDRSNLVSASIPSTDSTSTDLVLALAANTEYYYTEDAISYRRSSVLTLDTGISRVVNTSLEKIVDTEGNDLIPQTDDLTIIEAAEAALVTWGASEIDLSASDDNPSISFTALAYAVEKGQSTEAAQASLGTPARIELLRILFPSDSSQKWRRASGSTLVPDIESTSIGKDGSSDAGDFIDFSNGGLKYTSGIPVSIMLPETTATTVVNLDQSDFNAKMLAVPSLTKATYQADVSAIPTDNPSEPPTAAEVVAAIQAADFEEGTGTATLSALLASLKTSVDSISTGSAPSASDIVSAIQAADFSDDTGTQTLTDVLASILTAIGSAPSASDIVSAIQAADFSDDEDTQTLTNVLASILTAIGAISSPSASDIVTAIQAADFSDDTGTQTLTNVLASILTAIGAISPPSAADIVTAIQAADFSDDTGTQTLTNVLASILTAIGTISPPSAADIVTAIQAADFSDEENTQTLTNVLASILTDIAAISPPSAADIVTAIQAADFEAGTGTATLATLLASLKTAVDTIPTGAAPTASAVVTALQAADFSDDAGTQTMADLLAAILTAIGAISPPSASDIVTAIQAADFSDDEDTQTLTNVLASILAAIGDISPPTTSAIVTAIQAADFSDDTGTQTLTDLLAAILTAIGAISSPSAADIVTAIQAADFSDDENTQTLTNVLASILTAIGAISPPTTSAIVTAIQAADFEAGDNTGNLETVLASIKTAVDAISPPSTAEIATAVRNISLASGLTLDKVLILMAAIGAGRVQEDPDDESRLQIFSLLDDSLIASIPKFVDGMRPSGATVE